MNMLKAFKFAYLALIASKVTIYNIANTQLKCVIKFSYFYLDLF